MYASIPDVGFGFDALYPVEVKRKPVPAPAPAPAPAPVPTVLREEGFHAAELYPPAVAQPRVSSSLSKTVATTPPQAPPQARPQAQPQPLAKPEPDRALVLAREAERNALLDLRACKDAHAQEMRNILAKHNSETQELHVLRKELALRLTSQEALLVAQTQLEAANRVIEMYEARIKKLELEAVAVQSCSIEAWCLNDGEGVEEFKQAFDLEPEAGAETEAETEDEFHDEIDAEESQAEETDAETTEGEEILSDVNDEQRMDSEPESGFGSGSGSEPEPEPEPEPELEKPLIEKESTTRRVMLKKSTPNAPNTPSLPSSTIPMPITAAGLATAARVREMTSRDTARLTVPDLTALLHELGKAYVKPKAAALALLIATAKKMH